MLQGAGEVWRRYVRDKLAGRQPLSQSPWQDLALQQMATEQHCLPAGPTISTCTAAEPPADNEGGDTHAGQTSGPQRDAGAQQETSTWDAVDSYVPEDKLMQRLADLVAAKGTWTGRRDLRRKCTGTAIGQHTFDRQLSKLCAVMQLPLRWMAATSLSGPMQLGTCRRHLGSVTGIPVNAIRSSPKNFQFLSSKQGPQLCALATFTGASLFPSMSLCLNPHHVTRRCCCA